MNKILKLIVPAIVAFAALASATGALADSGGGGVPGPNNLFITSAVEHPGGTVTLPLHRGVSNGQTVYYVVTDVSDGNVAAQLGVNKAGKLANAATVPGAVEKVSIVNGVVNFPATVDFSPVHQLTAGPTGFPPATAQPGAIGQPGYSPLIELPNGTKRPPDRERQRPGRQSGLDRSGCRDRHLSRDGRFSGWQAAALRVVRLLESGRRGDRGRHLCAVAQLGADDRR